MKKNTWHMVNSLVVRLISPAVFIGNFHLTMFACKQVTSDVLKCLKFKSVNSVETL